MYSLVSYFLVLFLIQLSGFWQHGRHFWLFLFAFFLSVVLFQQTIWFGPANIGLAIAIIGHHMILKRNEQPTDDCASFQFSDITHHSTCFMCALMAGYVSIFQL